tara:strand:- start:1688 stop:2131 length:444 start_codon:yes stop_codon:yes gene_type:complete
MAVASFTGEWCQARWAPSSLFGTVQAWLLIVAADEEADEADEEDEEDEEEAGKDDEEEDETDEADEEEVRGILFAPEEAGVDAGRFLELLPWIRLGCFGWSSQLKKRHCWSRGFGQARNLRPALPRVLLIPTVLPTARSLLPMLSMQ